MKAPIAIKQPPWDPWVVISHNLRVLVCLFLWFFCSGGKSKTTPDQSARVDSVILEAQLGGPDPDSAQEWAVVHDQHKRHVNMGPARQT